MANNTKNYNLIKPTENEVADIVVINDNMDIIDQQMKPVNALNSSDGTKALSAAQGRVLDGKISEVNIGKVDKIAGKGLSTNDYTTAEKTKLAEIATGANKTVIANNLTTEAVGSALDAVQGRVLEGKISEVNSSLSEEIDERKSADTALKATLINENLLINGGFDIWQRGESMTKTSGTGCYADMWQMNGCINSIERKKDSILGNYAEVEVTDTVFANLYQIFEPNSMPENIPITFSFWFKLVSGTVIGDIQCRIGENQFIKYEPTNEWQKVIITVSSGKWGNQDWNNIALVRFTQAGQTNLKYAVAQAKLEVGTFATKFIPKNYGTELAKCQRYYETKSVTLGSSNRQDKYAIFDGIQFKEIKRAIPNVKLINAYTGAEDSVRCGGDGKDYSAIAINTSPSEFGIELTSFGFPASAQFAVKYIADANL